MTQAECPEPNTLRARVAGIVSGRSWSWPQASEADAFLAVVEAEGVTGLVHLAMADSPPGHEVPLEVATALRVRAQAEVARHMHATREAQRIQGLLWQAGIPVIWLKGMALGQWLYPQAHLRRVSDIDLLFADYATTTQATAVLAPLGYAPPNPHIAGDLVVHELLLTAGHPRLDLDMHWDLSNGALFAGRLDWTTLESDAVALPGFGAGARCLAPVHALLHACMHRTANALAGHPNQLRWLYDFHLLAQVLEEQDWRRLVEVASGAALADCCAEGLRASHAAFATEIPGWTMQALAEAAAREPVRTHRLGSWGYRQLATLRRLPSLALRMRWLRQMAFPDLAHLRVRYGADGAGHVRILARRLLDGIARWRNYMGR